MKSNNIPSLLLAVVLQVLPVTRVFLATSPVTGSSVAIVSTWIAGLAALLGGYNAVSGASTTITSSGTATGTNGTAFSYRITTGPDAANTFSAAPLPSGLTCAPTTGRITGTPTATGAFTVLLTASDSGSPSRTVTKNLALTILSGAPSPPGITTQPTSRTSTNGGSATFTVVASGSATLRYQWWTNGVELTGATNSTLTLSSITTNHVGNYAVVITNSVGSITSSTAVLTVLVPPSITTQPSNQSVTEGASPSFTVVAAGTATLGYQWRKSGVNVGGATSATLSFPSVTIGQAGSYTVVVTNSAGSITSSAVTLTVSAAPVAPSITTQPTNQTGTAGGSLTLTVVAAGTGPLNYQWRQDGGAVANETNSTFNLTSLTTNHAGSYAVVITNSVGSITSSVAIVTVNPAPIAPTITAQPESLTVTSGSNAAFSVTVTGTAPFRYQWRKAGVAVAGATNGTLTFAPAVALSAGDYTVVVTNVAGSVTSTVATLTVTVPPVPDAIRPTLAVVSPASALTLVTSNSINLSGTAADNQGVTSVILQQNGGADTSATGTSNWSATAALQPGTNTFRIKAADAVGNFSITNTRVVVYIVRLPLTLAVNGNGTLVGPTNGQLLELGKSYTLKATAKPGNVFSNWLVDAVSSAGATRTFNMASNLSVIANFVTNPFVALKGNYTGLFYPNTPEPPHEQSGHFTLTVTDKGGFSGKLLLAGGSYSVSGLLDLSLAGSRTVLRKGTNEVVLGIQLSAGSNQVSGYVSNAYWNSELFGYRATFDAKLNPATNHSGKYTMLLSGGEDAATSPAGQSPATLDLTTAGAVTLKGTLADGTAVAQKTTLAANGQTPVYVSLYKGRGSLVGWLTMMNTDTNDTPGLLLWTKKETAGGKIYLAGFTNETLALGSRYVAPLKGVAALGWSNGVALFEQGNLSVPMTNAIALSSANKFIITSTNTSKLALSLTTASGLLSGSFVHPDTLKKSAIKGVILQKQAIGGGFLMGTNQSGSVFVSDGSNGSPN